MNPESLKIKKDFDRIARLKAPGWDHNTHYHPFLLKSLPLNIKESLDIGCGTGSFSRKLAIKSEKVIGIDFSHEMIQKAIKDTPDKNIRYIEGDFLEYPTIPDSLDCIVSIATIHHLPLEHVLNFAKVSLRAGGKLIILDLYEPSTFVDYILSFLAVPANLFMSLLKTGHLKKSPKEIEAWREHAKNDRYMAIQDIKRLCNSILPGAKISRHLFWRYSLIWEKAVREVCGS